MAESDKILAEQVIEKNLFSVTTASARELKAELSELVVGFEGIIKANAEFLKQNKNGEDAKAIKANSQAIIQNEQARQALIKTKLAEEKVDQQLIKNGTEQLKQDSILLKNAQAKQAASDKEAKALANTTSAYKKLSDQLLSQKKSVLDLLAAEKALSEQDKLLIKNTQDLDAKLKAIDATVGNNFRNVGNYKSGFNGLSNSVNQLTREMPAFANSVQTGFMALSNNIPIFFDEISKVRKSLADLKSQGEQVPSLFSALASGVFTFGTALSIGVTVLTVFGKQMVEFIGDLFKADAALKISSETQSKYYSALKDKINSVIEAQIQLNVLNKVWTEAQAQNFRDGRVLNQNIVKDNQFLSDELVKQAKEWGIEITDIWDEKNKKLSFLSEGQMMTDQLRRSKDVFEEIEKNKERNKILRALFQEYLNLVEKDKKAFDKNVEVTETEAKIKADKDNEDKAKKRKAEHDKKMEEMDKEIIQEMEKIRERNEKAAQIEKDFANKEGAFKPEKGSETIWYDKENGITLEDHNATVDAIEKTRLKNIEDAKKAEELKQANIERIEQQTSQFLKQELDIRNAAKRNALDLEISEDQRKIDRQFQLAKDGKANQLAFEEQQLAKDQLAKKDLQQKEQREKQAIAFAEAYLNAYNAELKQPGANPTTAATKAFADVLIARGIAKGISSLAGYFEGTEDTGSGNTGMRDQHGNITGFVHEKERVMTAEQNAKIGRSKMSNEQLTDIAVKYNAGQLMDVTKQHNLKPNSFAENIAESLMYQELSKHSKSLEAIASKPVHTFESDIYHNLIEKIYERDRKTVITHVPKARL